MSAKLYVEGGGDSKALRVACRRGFRTFLEKAGLRGSMPRIVASGSRQNAYSDFTTALAADDGLPVLLVDAEGPVDEIGPWQHLHHRDGWARPAGATDEQCHLMVQVMESWFLADPDALAACFGQGFNARALRGNPNIEDVAKADVFRKLASASRGSYKGQYHKGSHSFAILAGLDPERVQTASPHAQRFVEALRR